MSDPDCFLCNPDGDLIVAEDQAVLAMVGLGPVSPTYAMLTTRSHERSLADLLVSDPAAVDRLGRMRSRIEAARGPLIMTEHGRVPICRNGNEHERHCFHAHALLFQVPPEAMAPAMSFYGGRANFGNLHDALRYASQYEAYLLTSPDAGSYEILSAPLNAPRQLTRTLAAIAIGRGNEADWRVLPRRDEAEAMTSSLRRSMETTA